MAQYQFRLDLAGSFEPLEEHVTATNLDEARNLAELRLLMSHDIRRVTVCEPGGERLHLHRDRRFDPAVRQDFGASRREDVTKRPAEGVSADV